MRARYGIDGRLKACVLTVWLVLAGAAIATSTDGPGRIVAVGAVGVAAVTGLLRYDWREALAAGLGGAALTVWLVSGDGTEATPLLTALSVVVTALVAAWAHPRAVDALDDGSTNGRQAQPAPAGARLPPGVADQALFERLAVHEMTRARRYERPLVLLLIGVDGWAALSAERGRREAYDLLATLAVRIRRLLRDVDGIGLHGDGRLAVLLPETPLDGALVVAGRIEQSALEDVGVRTRIGVAVFPEDAGTVEALIREAEAGLSLARIEGSSIVERVRLG